MATAGLWTLTLLPDAPNPNTYEVVSTARVGSCNQYLSCGDCSTNYADLYNEVGPSTYPLKRFASTWIPCRSAGNLHERPVDLLNLTAG